MRDRGQINRVSSRVVKVKGGSILTVKVETLRKYKSLEDGQWDPTHGYGCRSSRSRELDVTKL